MEGTRIQTVVFAVSDARPTAGSPGLYLLQPGWDAAGRCGGLEQDGSAIRAALTTPWSSGQAEGQITRLKLIKRQMYGRASFDLLRRRVLLAA